METQERYKESLEEFGDVEDAVSLLHIQKPPSRSRRWLEFGILLLLGLSICLNILTHFSGTQDLDDVCSIYTSQTGQLGFKP